MDLAAFATELVTLAKPLQQGQKGQQKAVTLVMVGGETIHAEVLEARGSLIVARTKDGRSSTVVNPRHVVCVKE